jgi:RND family efflux transporter MFP subunit
VLENHTIRAPIAGTIVELDAEEGQFVDPSTRLLTLADMSELVVEADVDEAYATQIAAGQQAVLQLAGETGTREGRVSFVSNRVDEATGGLAIKISFDAPVAAPIGLTVATNIIVDRSDAALSVPRTAVLTGPDGASVFVVSDGVARSRNVSFVEWPAARLIITSGLAEGDVVIADATGIANGQAVAVDQP